MRVVATAGHVDHGKSSLVLALTGTDPDRWAQEKERGLTIDLGFAFTERRGETIGFVDVPGHIRFVKNMLAGVGAVEVAMFVVAATEGWMPQSEEHLRILDLLGIEHGMVVITKADLVDDETIEIAALEVVERLEATVASAWPVVSVDSLSGRGLDDLRSTLDAVLDAAPVALDRGRPRLWVDRAFAAKGAGTVATGTLGGGSLKVDDEVVVVPGDRPARIRGIESANERLETISPGARVALNLAGIDHSQIGRGDAVVLARQWAAATTVDVALTPLPGERFANSARLHAHVGSGEHEVSLRTLDAARGFGRLRFARAVPIAPGDRIVLRSSARHTTVGGATVLDVAPARRTRDALVRLDLALDARVLAGHPVVEIGDLVTLAGVDSKGAEELAESMVATGAATRIGSLLVASSEAERIVEATRSRVREHHLESPSDPGVDIASLASTVGIDAGVLRALLRQTEPELVVERDLVRHREHTATPADDPAAALWLAELSLHPFDPPSPDVHDVEPAVVRALQRDGRVENVEGIWFATDALAMASQIVADAVVDRGSLTVADVRNLLGSTRKYVVPIVGYLDRLGVTRRRGDERIAGPRAIDRSSGYPPGS